MTETSYWTRLHRERMSRRALLRASGRAGVGAAGLALVGCGGDDDEPETDDSEDADDQSPPDDQTADAAAQDDPSQDDAAQDDVAVPPPPTDPVSGGIVHLFGITEEHDRWDPHRSRFQQTQSYFSLSYNRLVRPSSVSAGTFEPDLAQLPETPDETTHIFRIRPAARFWDDDLTAGRLFTADDARFNTARQQDALDAAGDPDLLFYRRAGFRALASVDTPDDATLTITTTEPQATLLSDLIAGPWGWMISPEGAQEFGDRWRDQPNIYQFASGTGPFQPVGFVRNGDVAFQSSENWWAPGSYPDGIIIRRVATQAIGQSYRDGLLDRVDFPLTKSSVEALREEFPDDPPFEIPLDTPVQLQLGVTTDTDNPLSDPRVGMALGLGIDRFDMIDRIYLGDGRPSGPLPWFLQGWALPESDLLERPGYRPDKNEDLPEIAALLDAAGGADLLDEIDLVVADIFEGVFPGIGQSLKTMLERNTGLRIDIGFQDYGQIRQRLADGELPAWFGWGAAPRSADPTEFFRASVHTDGDQNFGAFSDPEIDDLIDEMRITLDLTQRQALAQQVQDRLLGGLFWIHNVTNGIQLGLHRPFLHLDPRSFDFAWAGHHLDKVWIEPEHADYPADRVLPEAAERPLNPDAPIGPTRPPSDEQAEEQADAQASDSDSGDGG